MEENNDEPKVIYTAPNPFYTKRIFYLIITLIILTLLEIFLLSYFGFKINIFNKSPESISISSPPPQEKTIKESETPIAFDILKNPLVYEWRGSVEGTITAKNDHAITISDNQNHSIVIPVIPSTVIIYGTKFYKRETKNNVDQFINVSHLDLPLGSKLRGDFFVAAREKDKIIGSSFEVIEK